MGQDGLGRPSSTTRVAVTEFRSLKKVILIAEKETLFASHTQSVSYAIDVVEP